MIVFDCLRKFSRKLAKYAIKVKTQSALRINNSPSKRSFGCMFSIDSKHLLIFGGDDESKKYNDTILIKVKK